MTLTDSIKVCLDKYATMQGRASRSEYWWFVFFNYLVFFVAVVVFGLIGLAVNGYEGAIISIIVGYIFVCLALIIPNICVVVRRLHDTGHSGFWCFVSFVPLIGWVWFLYLMIKDGDDENEYGLPVY
jgi:uncharacterized membrane protein YhaH (DUF805 family)